MDQNVRASNRQAMGAARVTDDLSREPEQGATTQNSAMVVVLGSVALASMAFGFVLGLLF
jgi:hypothetical protein